MRSKSINGTLNWMVIWGWIDLANLAGYIGTSMYRDQIPIIDDILAAHNAYKMYGSSLPLIASYLGAILLISFAASGYLLVNQKSAGLGLAIAQSPFRLLLFMPSLFFLDQLRFEDRSPWILVIIIVLSELAKLWSIRGWVVSRSKRNT